MEDASAHLSGRLCQARWGFACEQHKSCAGARGRVGRGLGDHKLRLESGKGPSKQEGATLCTRRLEDVVLSEDDKGSGKTGTASAWQMHLGRLAWAPDLKWLGV